MSSKKVKKYRKLSSDIILTVGEKIAYYRKQRKMSQDALAEKLNKSRQTINGYENNKIELTLTQLQQVAEVLEVSITDFTSNIASSPASKNNPSIDELNNKVRQQEEEINLLKKELENKIQLLEANKKIIELYEKDISHYEKLLEDNEKLYSAIMKKFTS